MKAISSMVRLADLPEAERSHFMAAAAVKCKNHPEPFIRVLAERAMVLRNYENFFYEYR